VGDAAGSLKSVTDLRLDPELAAVVVRARQHADAVGELHPPVGHFESPLSSEARAVVAAWIADGGYHSAVAAVVAEDPDLADL
jgi:hypothetical protein